MSLLFVLELRTPASPDDILHRLRSTFPTMPTTGANVSFPAMEAYVGATDGFSREVMLDSWGVEATANVSFALYTNESDLDYEAARCAMSTACTDLVTHFDAPSVLHFQGDCALMLYRQGQLHLFDWWPEWTYPEVVSKIPTPFTMVHGDGTPESMTSLFNASGG